MMALDFSPVMIKVLLCVLATSALSKGMFINNKTKIFAPPPLGSPDRPIPPEYWGSGDYPPLPDKNMPQQANYIMDGGPPQIRTGSQMSYGMPNEIPVPTENYPMLPEGYSLPPNGYPLPPDSRSHSLHRNNIIDFSYCEMILEAPVPPTADQIPWFCTCTLCKGSWQSEKGDKGDRGLPGQPGSTGSRGLPGPRGPLGFTGPTGFKGQKGDEGIKGDDGPPGAMGRIGDRGFKGDKGDMGLDGMPGESGPPGPPGDCASTCGSVSGSPGEVGLPGTVGPRGLPGSSGEPGPKGEKGDQGEIGKPGVPGFNGLKGDQGKQGVCNCTDGAKGENGIAGPPGLKGEKGNAGSQGLEGVSGPKGVKGEMGVTGLPGPCSPAIQSGFSARLAITYPSPDSPVPFSMVIYNIENHYNPIAGVYKAPVNGTYSFSYNLCVFNKVLKVGLFQNFVPVVKSTGPINLAMVSQAVLLHLKMGDEVWIQVKDLSSNGFCTGSEASSTFTGYLLYPDSCDVPLSRDIPEPISGTYSWGDGP
ncbi:hypothetical protein Q7C36_000112 [Tachysurus vachellii]|uniref:C1q domain-containing protein n=2 Tax=Tachysurus vachellii TaxID=175792 RepID=A0AA88NX23_TACVA|nr:hypothetical protein Q7C36_000112 [Tachysurus vachellii]